MYGPMRRTLFTLLTLLVCGIAAPSVASANVPRGVEQEVAVVRVTIQQADGTVLRATKATHWGEVAQFDLGEHDLDLAVTDREHLGLHYTTEGAKVDKSLTTRPRSKLVVHSSEDVKITVQIIPITVRVHGEA